MRFEWIEPHKLFSIGTRLFAREIGQVIRSKKQDQCVVPRNALVTVCFLRPLADLVFRIYATYCMCEVRARICDCVIFRIRSSFRYSFRNLARSTFNRDRWACSSFEIENASDYAKRENLLQCDWHSEL